MRSCSRFRNLKGIKNREMILLFATGIARAVVAGKIGEYLCEVDKKRATNRMSEYKRLTLQFLQKKQKL